MTVVARNWQTRSRTAEADLIAWDGPTLVFVEVKTRASADFGTPDQAVDAEKRQKILRAAGDYIRRADLNWDVVRFDIVSVLTGNHPQVIHLTDAFGRRTSL
jgi:putative endonuclease